MCLLLLLLLVANRLWSAIHTIPSSSTGNSTEKPATMDNDAKGGNLFSSPYHTRQTISVSLVPLSGSSSSLVASSPGDLYLRLCRQSIIGSAQVHQQSRGEDGRQILPSLHLGNLKPDSGPQSTNHSFPSR